MDISEIIRIILAVLLVLSFIVFLGLCIALAWKTEKEHKELINEELKARIELYDAIKDYVYRGGLNYHFDD